MFQAKGFSKLTKIDIFTKIQFAGIWQPCFDKNISKRSDAVSGKSGGTAGIQKNARPEYLNDFLDI